MGWIDKISALTAERDQLRADLTAANERAAQWESVVVEIVDWFDMPRQNYAGDRPHCAGCEGWQKDNGTFDHDANCITHTARAALSRTPAESLAAHAAIAAIREVIG